MSITKDTAQTDANSNLSDLKSAALDAFVEAMDAEIDQAVAQGKLRALGKTFDKNLDPNDVFAYYTNLGYQVAFPDYLQNAAIEAAQLFGPFWINFWTGDRAPQNVQFPLRIIVDWSL